jgi:hypothetical protein
MAKAKCEVCNAEFWLYPKKNKWIPILHLNNPIQDTF